MKRVAVACVLAGLSAAGLPAFGQQNAGTRSIPGAAPGNAGTRSVPGGQPGNAGSRSVPGAQPGNAGTRTVPYSGGNAGTRSVPQHAQPQNAGTRQIPIDAQPQNAGARQIPGYGDGGFGNGGGAPLGGVGVPAGGYYVPGGYAYPIIVGQAQSGVVFPVAGNGYGFVGTTQPFVLAAPMGFGGPGFIQQPIFSEASVVGGIGGGVVGGSSFSRNSLGQRVDGGNFGGVGIGPGGGVTSFNNGFRSGIGIGFGLSSKLGNRGGFIDAGVGPRGPAVGPGGNVNGGFNVGSVNLGFNATAFQAAQRGFATFQPVVPGVVVIGGGGGGVMQNFGGGGMQNFGGGAGVFNGGVIGGGAAAPVLGGEAPRPAGTPLTPGDLAALRSPPDVSGWLRGMWQSAEARAFYADRTAGQRDQLFGYTLTYLQDSLAQGKPVSLPDGTSLQLLKPTLLVLTGPDGRSTTGWLKGQEMPEAFGVAALHLFRLAEPKR
jgi:hypothetical protein